MFDEKKLKMFGKDYVKVLIALLQKAGKRASGALINSIDSRVKNDAEVAYIELLANDYLEYVDKGRKPGKYPPIQAISKWCRLKGIEQGAAFPIARSIYKFGIKPTNVIQKTTKEILTSPTFQRKYEDAFRENIEELIFNKLKDIK